VVAFPCILRRATRAERLKQASGRASDRPARVRGGFVCVQGSSCAGGRCKSKLTTSADGGRVVGVVGVWLILCQHGIGASGRRGPMPCGAFRRGYDRNGSTRAARGPGCQPWPDRASVRVSGRAVVGRGVNAFCLRCGLSRRRGVFGRPAAGVSFFVQRRTAARTRPARAALLYRLRSAITDSPRSHPDSPCSRRVFPDSPRKGMKP
jgi:hypothetical protein